MHRILLKLIGCGFLLASGAVGQAQSSARVLQTKGRKAIVVFEESGLVSRGDRIVVETRPMLRGNSETGTRENFISGSGSLAMISIETEKENIPTEKEESTEVRLEGKYGWNQGLYEYGPVLSYESTTIDSDSSSDMSFGGFFDYNFYKPNVSGQKLVPTAGTQISFISTDEDSQSGSGFGFTTYIGGKYFHLTSNLAFTGFFNIDYESVSFSNGKTVSSMGPRVSVGLSQYF